MLNKVILMGRLVVDPEAKAAGNSSLSKFRIAVERPFVGQDGQRQTDFISCQAWGRTADFISKYFRKGQMIAVEGSLRQDNYTGSDGQERRTYVVNVDAASFCGSREETGGSAPAGASSAGASAAGAKAPDPVPPPAQDNAAPDDDDLPF